VNDRRELSSPRLAEWHAYRFLFLLAAAYNLAFGLWASLFPRAFFSLFELDAPRYPSIWSCVGMVVGVYGLAYAYVAFLPDRGDLVIAIGLLGKVLGPAGWVNAVATGELPPRTFPLILANDLIWWFPFLFYLLRGSRQRAAIIVWAGVIVHFIACVGLLLARGGTETEPDIALRANWVARSAALWCSVWFAWVIASLSLLALFVVWATRLVALGASVGIVALGCAICAIGLVFDLSGELVNIVRLTRAGISVEQFARGARLYALLGAATANGLYCIGGLMLSEVSRRVGLLTGWLGLVGFVMWTVGIALTVMAILDNRLGMILSGAGVMMLFMVWAVCLGWRLFANVSTAMPQGLIRTVRNRELFGGMTEDG